LTGDSILLITSDRHLSSRIGNALRTRRFRLRLESDAERGLAAAVSRNYDLVLMDAALAGGEVVQLVQQVRQHSRVPLIVLSAQRRPDLVAMLDNGADDCISARIEPEEVAARVGAVLRREGCRVAASDVIEVGSMRIEPGSRSVLVEGTPVDITSIEYDVLEYLAREAGRIVPREELMTAAFGRERSPLDRSLDVHISHVRRKLRHGTRIVTVRGVGYMLTVVGPESEAPQQ
jgi:two-component system, OmpR family, response regulator CpxR